MMRRRVLLPLCRELRHSFQLPEVEDESITEFAEELVGGHRPDRLLRRAKLDLPDTGA